MKLGDLKLGDQVKDWRSELSFSVAATDHPGYDGVVLVCDNVIRCAAFDGAEPESKGCRFPFESVDRYGRNNYALSNIHQWLNSGETFWYRPTHETDTPPQGNYLRYNEQANFEANGFLRELSPAFVSAMVESDVPVLVRKRKGQGELTTVKARVFLPSRTEIGLGDESGFAEGAPLPFFEGRVHLRCPPTEKQMAIFGRAWNPGWDYGLRGSAPLDAAQIFDPKHVWWWWCRTPHLTYAFLVRVMCANGGFSYTHAFNDIVGVRPMTVLAPDTVLEDGYVI